MAKAPQPEATGQAGKTTRSSKQEKAVKALGREVKALDKFIERFGADYPIGTPPASDIASLRTARDQALQRMALAQTAVSAAQSEYAKARKAHERALLAYVEAVEATQGGQS